MTSEEKQEIINAVLSSLRTNSKTIAQLTPVTDPNDSDSIELSGGKRITFVTLKEKIAGAVSVTANQVKGYVSIESTDDLPEEPTPTEQQIAYLLDTVLYVYVGTGGDTLGGKYKSVDMKGPKGDSGVHLGDVVLVNNLTEGGEGSALTAEMGKKLKELIDSQTFSIVNDLFTGGEESALSAEMGKKIGETLELDSSSEVVSELIPYGQTIGYITTYNPPTKAGNSQYSYTDPIFLKAGESLTIKGCTPTSVMRIASWNPDTEALGRILVGTSAGNGAQYIYENTYTATEDIYVIISWHWASGELELTKTYTKVSTTSRIDDIDVLNDALDVSTETEEYSEALSPQSTNGQYYAAGTPCDLRSGNFSTTEEILVKAGETLQVVVHSVPPSVSALCKREGSRFRNIAAGDNTATQTITFTPAIDEYCVVSFFTSKGYTITKSGTRTTSDSERIKNLEDAILPITPLLESMQTDVEALNDAIFLNTEDELTEDIVSGYFITATGVISTNESFFYKEFSVKANTLITFTAVGHSNCAPISKKISTNNYEVLATPAQGRHTNTYTATEDCTIAVSGYGGNNYRLVTFYLQYVESNTMNIENILSMINAFSLKFKTPDYGLLFDKIAVIGDSLTVGTLDAVSGDDAHAAGGSFGCSWLTCLAKRWGSTIRMHYGVGGSTCYSWLGSNQYGLGLMLKDSVIYDAYFIAYGHNDTGKYTIGTTSDTPTDVTVDENNDVTMETAAADTTFLGNYKKIVNEIRTKAPNALIFMLCTDAKDSSTTGTIGNMNQYIRQLAEWYYAQGDHRVFYVDYINSYARKSGDHTGGHWSTFGYVNIALAINDALNEVIEQNMNTNALKVWGNYLESYRTTKNDQTRSGGYLPHL